MQTSRIFIVDDEVLVRQGLSARLSNYPNFKIAGVSSFGTHMLAKLESAHADALILNLESAGENSCELLRNIRSKFPDLLVLSITDSVFSAKKVPQDLIISGRSEIILRPRQVTTVEKLLDELTPLIYERVMAMHHAMTRSKLHSHNTLAPESKTPSVIASEPKSAFPVAPELPSRIASWPSASTQRESDSTLTLSQNNAPLSQDTYKPGQQGKSHPPRIDLLVIASSTGGPNALNEILPKLPANFPVPILIVQHMPAEFTKSLAERLNTISALEVREAVHGDYPKAGLILIAPGDYHMLLERSSNHQTFVRLNQGVPENSCRPAADVLFRSASKLYGHNTLALILTGMGRDGLAGSELIKQNGGSVVVQDEPTSVVWGMPGEIAKSGLADAILPLQEIKDEIVKRVCVGRS
jgi:two-component system, chemotaxis family, protein-glutamate methylesterase/glutaminase